MNLIYVSRVRIPFVVTDVGIYLLFVLVIKHANTDTILLSAEGTVPT